MIAAQSGFMDLFDLLIRSGADADAKTADGQTILDIAASSCRYQLAAALAAYRREQDEIRRGKELL